MHLEYRGLKGHYYYISALFCYIGELACGDNNEEVISFSAPTKTQLFLVMAEAVKAHFALHEQNKIIETV